MYYDGHEIIEAGCSEPTATNIHFNWYISDMCNYKCNYCSAGYGDDSTRPSSKLYENNNILLWRLVLNKLRKIQNNFTVCLVGGEPTLHPQLPTIIEHLIEIEMCTLIEVTTNLTKPAQYFIDLPKSKKVRIHASIHFDYFKDSIIDKIILIDNHTDIQASVMLNDNKKYIDDTKRCLERLKQNNIRHECVMLHDIKTRSILYDNDQLELLKGSTTIYKHRLKTGDKELYLDQSYIRKNKMYKFKNWSCYARGWDISPMGEILHSCTNNPLNIDKINDRVICPHNSCTCAGFWDFTKHK